MIIDSWEQAKAQCESFDYLFETAVKMKGMGLESGVAPMSGSYRDTYRRQPCLFHLSRMCYFHMFLIIWVAMLRKVAR